MCILQGYDCYAVDMNVRMYLSNRDCDHTACLRAMKSGTKVGVNMRNKVSETPDIQRGWVLRGLSGAKRPKTWNPLKQTSDVSTTSFDGKDPAKIRNLVWVVEFIGDVKTSNPHRLSQRDKFGVKMGSMRNMATIFFRKFEGIGIFKTWKSAKADAKRILLWHSCQISWHTFDWFAVRRIP
jgi:hypothetical protein